MSKKHALLGASNAHRWMVCTKSAKLEEGFPDKGSTYAEEGTAAHLLAEIYAKYAVEESDEATFLRQKELFQEDEAHSKYYTEDMRDSAESYGAFIKEELLDLKKDCEDPVVFFETRVDFSEWVPEGFGTADCLIIADGLMEVVDFKYGKGVRVQAFENPQMMLYALGAYQQYKDIYDIEKVKMSIFQPRIANEPTFYVISVKELLTWAKKTVRPAAKLAIKGQGEYVPSEDTCRFCKAKNVCRARYKANIALFDDNPDPDKMSLEEIGEVLKKAKDIKAWLSDMEAHVLESLLSGNPVSGWKIVEGRSIRKLTDAQEAADRLLAEGIEEDKIYERSMYSLAQLEKSLGKKLIKEVLEDLIEKPEGKPTLAPEEDKRPAFDPKESVIKAL